MGSHSVTGYPPQVNTPRLTPAGQTDTRFTYPGTEGWVDLCGSLHVKTVYLSADSRGHFLFTFSDTFAVAC